MASRMPLQIPPRPDGDPLELRDYARRIGGFVGHVEAFGRRARTAGDAALANLPAGRVQQFHQVARDVHLRHGRLRRSLQTVEGALLDYANHLERAQEAVDRAANGTGNGPDGSPAHTTHDTPMPLRDGHRMQAPHESPIGVDDDRHHMRTPRDTPMGSDGPHRMQAPGDGGPHPSGSVADAESALAELRFARQRCMTALQEVRMDWTLARSGPPLRWSPVLPFLPSRRMHTGPMTPIARTDPVRPPVRRSTLPTVLHADGRHMSATPVRRALTPLRGAPNRHDAGPHMTAGPVSPIDVRRIAQTGAVRA